VFGATFGPAVIERISPTVFYAFSARASVTVHDSPSSIATPFEGVVEYCILNSDTAVPIEGSDYSCPAEKATTHVRCESQGNRLTLLRR
jgi:hypothetical protein